MRARTRLSSHARPSTGRLGWLALAAVAAFVLLTGLNAGDSPAWTAFDDVSEALVAVLATTACAIRFARERSLCSSVLQMRRQGSADVSAVGLQRQARIAWLLLTAGVGAWALGQIGWCVYEVGFAVNPPTPSPLDGLFLLSSVLVVCGLLAMVRTPAGYLSHLRGVIEGLFIATGFFLCSWSLAIGSVLAHSQTATLGGLINLAYPLLDALALSAVFFVLLRRRADAPAGLGLLALGIVWIAASDSAYWYLTEMHPEFPGVSPLDTGWVAGFLLVALGALRSPRPSRWGQRLLAGRLSVAAPSMPACAGVLIVVGGWLLNGSVGSQGVLMSIMAVVVMLGVSLLLIVTYENRALTSDLERRVERRTGELRATERYYRALVQHSSDVVMVVDPDLRIRFVSDSIEKIFGYRPEQLAGRSLDVLGGTALATLTEALELVGLEPDQPARVQWQLTDRSGRPRWAESMVTGLLSDRDVGGFVLNTRDDTDRVALAEQLRRQAFHDPLTGLANRALLSDRASQAFARSGRSGASVAVMAIDLDAFKLVNDGFGHRIGDMVLRAVAERLQSVMRPEDTVARLGGDEFVVLMGAVLDTEDALAFAERIRSALLPELTIEGAEHRVTASIGVAIGSAPQSSFDESLSDADVALYAIKAAGKDSVQLFEPSMHLEAGKRFKLQSDIRRAMENEEFWLLYEPEFHVDGEQLDGFEALIRWNHPTLGLMAPERFMPLAEETGLIVPLGRWVLDEALRQAATWNRTDVGARPLSISVNVSAAQLNAPSLLADVESAIRSSGIDSGQVVLEIAASALVDCSPRVIEILRTLKTLGVRLAIDEFGSGYASVAHLQSMPLDILKLDPSLVASSGEGGRGREMLEAVVNMGRSMSLVTIADGVEQASQLAAAKHAGCDLAQGYLLARPMPSDEAERLIVEFSHASRWRREIATAPWAKAG
jgi:diguanylate cyclase (GGDEF)-like protein/PAS domain S-box-containing protein